MIKLAEAKNNYFVMTYFKPGANCTQGASGKTQETFQMNICLDTMQKYVEYTPGYVTKETHSDYKCTSVKSTNVYALQKCQKYDTYNDLYPSAY